MGFPLALLNWIYPVQKQEIDGLLHRVLSGVGPAGDYWCLVLALCSSVDIQTTDQPTFLSPVE